MTADSRKTMYDSKKKAKEQDDSVVQSAVESKVAAKKAAKAKALTLKEESAVRYNKYKDGMKNPHVSNEAFCTAAWMKINCKDGGRGARAVIASDIDSQREYLAFRRFGAIQPW